MPTQLPRPVLSLTAFIWLMAGRSLLWASLMIAQLAERVMSLGKDRK
jgi:hypothetical protein